MPSQSALNAAHKIQARQTENSEVAATDMAAIIEQEVGFEDAITALIRCDRQLEQLGVSVNERDFLLKAIAKLEGSESAPSANAVIGTVP
ncbi:MAG: hypothetical protein HY290_06095 [Planctomycetia bacterium]|nr:hypothetical protein [Planctomycetia bacterium]